MYTSAKIEVRCLTHDWYEIATLRDWRLPYAERRKQSHDATLIVIRWPSREYRLVMSLLSPIDADTAMIGINIPIYDLPTWYGLCGTDKARTGANVCLTSRSVVHIDGVVTSS